MKLTCFLGIVALTLGAAACNQAPVDAEPERSIVEPGTAANSGSVEQAEASAAAVDDVQPSRTELPRSASPLALVRIAGLLSLAGVIAVRLLRW